MAGFGFSESQEMFRRQVRNFVQKEIAPDARLRSKQDSYPMNLIRRMGEMGLMGINQPEKYGGQPADWVTLGIGVEEVARGDFNLAIVPTLDAGFCLAFRLVPEDVQAEWLPRVISGEILASVATTEPGCGSDVGSMTTRAVRQGDYYILNGEKTSITVGMQSEACIVFAKTDPTKKARGVSAFLVPLNSPGVHRSRLPDMGCKPMGRCSIILDNVKVPVKYRMGEEGKGFYVVMGQFDLIRINLGLMALGAAQTSMEDAIGYAKQRTAFGSPLAKYEGISFKIAEHCTRIEAARLLCYRTLWLRDQGQNHTKESAMCKFLGPKVAVAAIHDALLVHGHIGYSEEFPIEQRLRDVIGWEMADGTAEIMKIVISRELMGREFLPY